MRKQMMRALAVLGALSVTLFMLGSPVIAKYDKDGSSGYTEDNDSNDNNTPNDVSDDGDNSHPSGKDRSVEHGGSGNQGDASSNPDDSKGPERCEGVCGEADEPNSGGGTDSADQDGNNGCGNDDDFDDDNNGWCGHDNNSQDTDSDDTDSDDTDSDDTDSDDTDSDDTDSDDTDSDDTDSDGDDLDKDANGFPCVGGATMHGNVGCDEDALPPCEDDATMDGDVPCAEATPPHANTVTPDKTDAPDDEVLGETVDNGDGDADETSSSNEESAAPSNRGAMLPFTGTTLVPFLLLGLVCVVIGMVLLKARRSH